MYSLVFAARLAGVGIVSLIATSFPAATQDRNVARCLSIADVNERIDCLESGGIAPNPGTNPIPTIRSPKQPQAGPSFDCRAANSSIERAICADAALTEWDLRMSQQYQHALRNRNDPETQSIMENQRVWLLQRNSRCSGGGDIAIRTCLLDMTKQRVDVLTKLVVVAAETVPTSQPQTITPTAPKNLPSPAFSTPSPNPAVPSAAPISKSSPSPVSPSEGSNSFLIVLFVLGAAIGGIAVVRNVNRRKRRERLVATYGEQAADRILARQVWQGMTDEQLVESWGLPADKDTEIKRTTTKETWKYGQTGKNRFNNRVYLENGIVIGWKN
jgi:uncharacterized protein